MYDNIIESVKENDHLPQLLIFYTPTISNKTKLSLFYQSNT